VTCRALASADAELWQRMSKGQVEPAVESSDVLAALASFTLLTTMSMESLFLFLFLRVESLFLFEETRTSFSFLFIVVHAILSALFVVCAMSSYALILLSASCSEHIYLAAYNIFMFQFFTYLNILQKLGVM
jgi:hypothetical protein